MTIPSIATAVRITNEGSTAYEYQYTWCITNSDTNLCGGGNDIFTSMAAKLIQPGENFDSILNSVVSVAGNYWFHIEVQYGSESSHASQSFIAKSETGGGGGGGGGGGTILPSPTPAPTCIGGADLNCDSVVNSVDFSIMLAFWKTRPPFKNIYVDINKDSKVDSVDFSILLYQWGKKPTSFKMSRANTLGYNKEMYV